VITQIVSKYIFRFRDSIDRFQERFPDRGEIQVMRFARKGGEDGGPDLTPLFASLDERRRHVKQIQGTYATHPTSLHLFAEAIGGHMFDAMTHLTVTPDAGIRWCCQGGEEERVVARQAARDQHSVVVDLTALFAVWRLELADLLRRWKNRRLVVTQASFDRLRIVVQSEGVHGPRRHISAGERGGYAYHEVPEGRRAGYVESLQGLLDFVRQHCAVVCATEIAAMDDEQRQMLIDLFGRDGLESVVVASRPGHLLWSDDLTVAIIARDVFNSQRRVWTQVLLQEVTEERLLTQTEFDRYSAQLIGLGYSFSWCSPGIIGEAGEMVSWRTEVWPLFQVIGQFGQPGIPPQVKVDLAAQAIVLMYRAVNSPFAREAFIRAILNRLASRRLAQHLAVRVARVFGVDVLKAAEALDIIRDWPFGGLILP
jgi:hypothetical protein